MKDQQAIKRGAVCTALVGAWAQRRSLPAIVGLGVSLAASSLAATTPPATSYEATDLNGIVASETWACGAGGSQQVGYACYGDPSPVSVYAVLWTGSAGSAVDLHPFPSFTWSGAEDTDGVQQVGWGQVYYVVGGRYPYIVYYYRPLLWTGSAASVVDLHPAGFGDCWVHGVGGGQEVGYGSASVYISKKVGYVARDHALLWAGSAASVVDLHPAGFTSSAAYGVAGGQQGGYDITSVHINKKVGYVVRDHALLWAGTAASVVDLHPAGFTSSLAYGVGGGQQVGYGVYTDENQHALLWAGSAASAVDLHPAGFASSVAKRVHNGHQVGYGQYADLTQHALVWNGTAASVVDLHPFLPAGYPSSVATGIDAAGNVVGYAWDPHLATALGNCHSFLWKPQ